MDQQACCHAGIHALTAAKEHRNYPAAANLSDALLLRFEQGADAAPVTAEEALRLPAARMLHLTEAQAQTVIGVLPECLRYAAEISTA